MSLQSVDKRVVDWCNQGKNFDVMHTLYASVEPTGQATLGKQAVIDKSKRWAEGVPIHGETVIGPWGRRGRASAGSCACGRGSQYWSSSPAVTRLAKMRAAASWPR